MPSKSTVLAAIVLTFLPCGSAMAGGALQFRLGGFAPAGGGDFWTDTEDTFALETADFRSGAVGFSFIAGFNRHLEVGLNLDYSSATVVAGYRDYVDGAGFPIVHDTRLSTMPLTVDLRILPLGRARAGHARGAGATHRPVLYLGGGLGMTIYNYEEAGDFIDFSDPDLPIVFDSFSDRGTALETHALAGIELPFGRNWAMIFEAKYSWADAELGGGFAEMGSIELGGPSGYVGMSVRF